MNEIISKQQLEAALKQYKTKHNISNVYFHLDNYDNDKIIMNSNRIIRIFNRQYNLHYNLFSAGSEDYIFGIIKQAYIKPHETVIISIASITASTIILVTQ